MTAYIRDAVRMSSEGFVLEPVTNIDAIDKVRLTEIAQSMRTKQELIKLSAETKFFRIYTAEWTQSHFGGLINNKMQAVRVMDSAGSIRLQIQNGVARTSSADQAESAISAIAEEHSVWGDAGKVIPDIMILAGPKIIDLSGLLNVEHVNTLAKAELNELPRNTGTISYKSR